MVAPGSITTYADLDLVAQAPAPRSYHRTTRGGVGAPGGPVLGSKRVPYTTRRWSVTLQLAGRLDRWRAQQLWEQCSRGLLPVAATPPGGGDPVPVIILGDVLTILARSAQQGAVQLEVERWRG